MGIAQQMEALSFQMSELRNSAKSLTANPTDGMTISEVASLIDSYSGDVSVMPWPVMSQVSEKIKTGDISASEFSSQIGVVRSVNVSGYGVFDARLIGVAHDELSDGSGKAGFTWHFEQLLNRRAMNSDYSEKTEGWLNTELRNWMNSTLILAFPDDLSSSIKEVKKKCANGYSNDALWTESLKELLGNDSEVSFDEGSRYQWYSQNDKYVLEREEMDYRNIGWWTRTISGLESTSFESISEEIMPADDSSDYVFSMPQYSQLGISVCFCV